MSPPRELRIPVRPTLSFEKAAGFPSIPVAGVDEVGVGCLAGPVVAAVVLLPAEVSKKSHPWLRDVNDSKTLDEEERERLAPLIQAWAAASAIGVCTPAEIDQHNILRASHLAAVRAIESLSVRPQHVIIDGRLIPRGLTIPVTPVIKGDLRCLSVACASIVAKVFRDRWMKEQDSVHPGYGFGVHKGYGTPKHLVAMRTIGICALHRRSFAPVAALLPESERTAEVARARRLQGAEVDEAALLEDPQAELF